MFHQLLLVRFVVEVLLLTRRVASLYLVDLSIVFYQVDPIDSVQQWNLIRWHLLYVNNQCVLTSVSLLG